MTFAMEKCACLRWYSSFPYLAEGHIQKLLHHLIHIEVLQVWVVTDGSVAAGLVPTEAIWGVVAVGKDA